MIYNLNIMKFIIYKIFITNTSTVIKYVFSKL